VFRGPIDPLPTDDDHLIAFVRDGRVATLATRLPVGLARRGGWGEATVELPAGRWRDELTGATHDGGRVSVASVLGTLPVSLLVRED
jgi:(1->4)-alpha-D-glucan 1-alpha-D-glucosylmutase